MSLPSLETPELAEGESQRLDQALVAAFLQNVPDFVYFKDREGRFIAVSQSKIIRNGLRHRAEIIGKTDFDFFTAKNASKTKADEDEVMRTGVPMIGREEKVTWADGRETWSLVSKLPLRDHDGTIIGTFGLTRDITEVKQTQGALEKAQRELVDASRQAGMAEIATGVLHNVGNVLNSVNVSATLLATGLRDSKAATLGKVSALLKEHTADLGDFLTSDPRGRRIPELIASLAQNFAEERTRLLGEIESLQHNIDHIKDIVSMQQSFATMVGIVEPLSAAALLDDAVRMNSAALSRHDVKVVRDFQFAPPVYAEKPKVLQILVNFIRNAKYACDDGPHLEKVMTLRIAPSSDGRTVLLSVGDNGVGIPPENLTRIFAHGFTTRAKGHGFGLHSSANAAKEMKGRITVQSDGPAQGATFTLELPVATPDSAATPI